MQPNLLDRVNRLALPEERASAAVAIGQRLGGDSLVVFLRDEQVGQLLPAPGFPQTLPGGRAWRSFLERCVVGSEACAASLSPPGGGVPVPAYGISSGLDIVAVVLGSGDRVPELSELQALLPLLASIFRAERGAAQAGARARVAGQAAAYAESLSVALEGMRGQVQRALVEASEANTALVEVNRRLKDQTAELESANHQLQDQAAELEAQTAELEAANHQLQDQAAELEAQTEELESQADQLRESVAALDSARQLAEAANMAKSEFLAMMSHELRTPLNAIGGHVQLIQLGIYGPVTASQAEALQRVDRSQRHLLGLINDVLNLARIESGRLEYRIEDVSVAEAILNVQPMITVQIETKELHFEMRVADPEIAVRADADKLQQILLNLLSNAVKFTCSGGSVTLDVSTNEETPEVVQLTVTDSGMGIPVERLSEIFEPFVQVNSLRTRKEEGTGLGLAISRDLARGMGGDLTAESTLDVGSAFTLTLPRA